MREEELIEVSHFHILLTAVPLLMVAGISARLNLNLEQSILTATARTYIQLNILSLILDPIFSWGVDLWWVVVGYTIFMILLAAVESASRSKYWFDGMKWYVLGILMFNIAWVSIFAFAIILVPSPLWDPQYVIPVVGMLLGNCINGISLALNAMLTSMAESSSEVELYLSFGGTSYEASSRLLKDAVRTGTMPQLNSMAIIGIISIPGMMTGQILGGSSVTDAARYQILIMYLIATCSFCTIFSLLFFTLRVCFDLRMTIRTEILQKRKKRNTVAASLDSLWIQFKQSMTDDDTIHDHNVPSSLSLSSLETQYLSPGGALTVSTSPVPPHEEPSNALFTVSDLAFAFAKLSPSGTKESHRRTLFQDISFQLVPGQSALVRGPSGAGKSTLLRILAGLMVPTEGILKLQRSDIDSFSNMTKWRKEVVYVPQTKPDIPGSPMDFLQKITSFRSWSSMEGSASDTSNRARAIAEELGVDLALLDSAWKDLSGGESQRILLAIAVASQPRVLLLDESTSALDAEAKLRVEKLVETYRKEFGLCAVWITHDEAQKNRVISN